MRVREPQVPGHRRAGARTPGTPPSRRQPQRRRRPATSARARNGVSSDSVAAPPLSIVDPSVKKVTALDPLRGHPLRRAYLDGLASNFLQESEQSRSVDALVFGRAAACSDSSLHAADGSVSFMTGSFSRRCVDPRRAAATAAASAGTARPAAPVPARACPCASAIALAMGRPSPVPLSRERAGSPRLEPLEDVERMLGAIPGRCPPPRPARPSADAQRTLIPRAPAPRGVFRRVLEQVPHRALERPGVPARRGRRRLHRQRARPPRPPPSAPSRPRAAPRLGFHGRRSSAGGPSPSRASSKRFSASADIPVPPPRGCSRSPRGTPRRRARAAARRPCSP